MLLIAGQGWGTSNNNALGVDGGGGAGVRVIQVDARLAEWFLVLVWFLLLTKKAGGFTIYEIGQEEEGT